MTTRDAIELARGMVRDGAWLTNDDVTLLARALLASAERCERLEAACLYLYRAWADAEGEGQPEMAIFGIADDECENGAPPEIQAALRKLLEP